MNKRGFVNVCGLIFVCIMFTGTLKGQNAYTKLCLEAISFEEAGMPDKAVEKYSQAISMKPEEWTGYNYRAKVNYHMSRYDDAISDLSRAVTLSPDRLSLYAERGNCYRAKGLYDRAIEDYNIALAKPGKNEAGLYMIHYNRGLAYFNTGKYQESLNDFSKAIGLAEKDRVSVPEIYEQRVRTYLKLKRYTEALSDLDILLLTNPDDIKILLLQGYAFLKNNNKQKAQTLAEKIVKLDPARGIYFSGNRMTDIFDLDMRREKAGQLTGLAGELIEEQSAMPSKVLAAMKLRDAFTCLDTALIYNPGFTAEDRDLHGKILEDFFKIYPLMKTKPEIPEQVRKFAVQASGATQDKKYSEAIGLWSVTLDMAPYYPLAWYNRALLYERAGQFKNSISDMESYLKLMPDASDARSSRDKIYEWEGKIKDLPSVTPVSQTGAINKIESKSFSPGHFNVAIAFGGSFGYQFNKNPDLADLWTQSTAGATPDYNYSDKLPFLYSGGVELTVKPAKMIGIGAFGKMTGGIGAQTKVGEVKYILNMSALQYGGFIRYYIIQNNGSSRPDLYVQYAYGRSNLTGYYGVATMDGIIFDYSHLRLLRSSAPYQSAGVGMGGRLGKKGYLTISLDYMQSQFKEISYEVTIDKANQAIVGNKGIVKNSLTDSNTTAKYDGVLLNLLFGICF